MPPTAHVGGRQQGLLHGQVTSDLRCREASPDRACAATRFHRLKRTDHVFRFYPRVMDTADVDAALLGEVCERYGVASLEVFGSLARGDDDAESDVDLLYVLKDGVRLGFALFDLEDELADLFGRPVDLVARRSVNRYLREVIESDARLLYAA